MEDDKKMTNVQRMESDMATMDRREMADKTLSDNRNRNDLLTQERRFKADKTMGENRLKNDEMTANRRETKDGNLNMTLLISLSILAVLAVAALFIFI